MPGFGHSVLYMQCERGRERWRGVECTGRQSKNGGGYGGYTDLGDGGSCGHQFVGYDGLTAGCTLAVLASLYSAPSTRVNCSVGLNDIRLFLSHNFNQNPKLC